MTDTFLLVPTRHTGTITRTVRALGVRMNANLHIITERLLRIDMNLLEHSMTHGRGVHIVHLLVGQIVGLPIYGNLTVGGSPELNDLFNRLKPGSKTTTHLVAVKNRKEMINLRAKLSSFPFFSYSAPSGDRYLPEYSRDPRDFNQASRSHGPDHYAPVTSSVDHYRSYSNSYDSRDLYPNSRADSYRPQYEEDTSWNAPPVSAMARNVRTRTPDDFESPPREPRSAYVHRLPLPYADREARHYSPTRPIAYSPRARRSPSPTPYRYNNSRTNFNDNGRLQPARRVVSSPARSFKRESSPAIPGLIHGVHTNTVFQQPRQPNATPPVLQKRPSPALSDDQLPSRKKLRSVSPERHSSIASSRPSSPEPILVVGQPGVVRKVEEKNHDPRPPTTNHSSPPPEDDTGSFYFHFMFNSAYNL